MGNFSLWIHPYTTHQGHIEHERAIRSRQTGDVMPSTLDTKQEVVFTREPDGSNHVSDTQAANHEGWPPIDHGVPDRAGLFITSFTWQKQGTLQAHLQAIEDILLKLKFTTI
jgi:hypothetical protein